MATIADRLNELRGDMTITEMGRRVGIGTSTIYNYLHDRDPGADVIVSVCRAFDVNERWLLTGEGPKLREPLCYPLVASEGGHEVLPKPRPDVDLTDPEFYRRRITEIVQELDLEALAELYFDFESRRVEKLVARE